MPFVLGICVVSSHSSNINVCAQSPEAGGQPGILEMLMKRFCVNSVNSRIQLE